MIERASLRKAAFLALRDRILRGSIAPGTSIREPVLARELNVSRTPLREALLKLEGHGLVTSTVGRGFAVPPLLGQEAEDCYTILATLDGLALRTAGFPSDDVLHQLDEINAQIRRSRRADRLFASDRRWHCLLVAHCRNERLRSMIDELLSAVQRYDYAYWREAGDVSTSHNEHQAIVKTLRRGKLESAAQQLTNHWLRGIKPVTNWLAAQHARKT